MVSFPVTLSMSATAPQVSIGAGWTAGRGCPGRRRRRRPANTASVAALSPGLPVEDVVVGLALQVVADDRGVGVEGPAWRRRPRGSGSYSTSISSRASRAEYRSSATTKATSWPWKRTLSVASTASTSPRQGRHPGQAERLEVCAGDDRLDLRVGLGGGGVDRDDPGVGERAAQDRAVQHPGQLEVVDEGALAADEAGVLLALDRPVGPGLGRSFGHASTAAWRRPAAPVLCWPTAWPARCSRSRCTGRSARRSPRGSRSGTGPGCGRAASGRSSSSPACRTRTAARGLDEALLDRVELAARSSPSTVRTWCPSAMAASTVQLFTGVRPATPRTPRSWRCRSPSACRSGPGGRGGSGPAAAAARRPGCSSSPLTVMVICIRRSCPGRGAAAPAQRPDGELAGQMPLVVGRAALVGTGWQCSAASGRPRRSSPRWPARRAGTPRPRPREVPAPTAVSPIPASAMMLAVQPDAPRRRRRPPSRPPGAPPSRRRCRRRAGSDPHLGEHLAGRHHGLVRARCGTPGPTPSGCRPGRG